MTGINSITSGRLALYFERLFDLIASISFEFVKAAGTAHFREAGEKSLIEFKKNLKLLNSNSQLDPHEKQCDTILVPSIQLAALDVHNDQRLLEAFLAFTSEHFQKSTAFFTTGYFNLSSTILEHMLKSKNIWSLITSSPRANTFYKSRGVTSLLPSMYRANLVSACKYLSDNKLSTPSLFEHTKSDWTFHAKGILVADGCSKTAYVIGSSNFGNSDNLIFTLKGSALWPETWKFRFMWSVRILG